jgi:hypothetical protein
MKKFFLILFAIIALLLALLITAPVLFKGKIITLVNEQLEKNLNAKASVSDIKLSLIRNFPNVSVRLKDLQVIGIREFSKDTLISVNSFDLVADIISVIKMESIDVKRIIIHHPSVNAIVLKDGKANWDIVPESDTTKIEPVDTVPSEFTTKVALKLFKITDARIRYTDYKSDMSASLEHFNFELSGNLSQDFSVIRITSESKRLNFIMGGIPYLKNVRLGMHFEVDANLKESIYKLNENHISLNELTLGFDGDIEMPESGDILTNLHFATSNTDFKTLLSLIPAIYRNDFNDLKTTGTLKLEGKITGAVTEKTTPNASIKLLVQNATFSYPDLPKSAKDIQIDVDIHYDGTQMDNTTVDVNKFHMDLGDNPIDMVLNLRTPTSDPFTNGKITATIDLQTLQDVIPMKDTELKGIIKANLDWMGKLSSIENQKYEEFKADGMIEAMNILYSSPDLPKTFSLKTALIKFSPQFVDVSSFDAKLGASDFRLNGRLTNFIPYALKDETVKGQLNLYSHTIDLNEFLSEEEVPEEQVQPEDTTALKAFEVPTNIDFRFTSSIGYLKYDKLDIKNLLGIIYMKDGRVVMENLSMNTLDGSLKISGEYNSQDIRNPLVDFHINASGIDIPKAFVAFDILGKIAPIASKATGKITLGLSYSSLLKSDMKPVLNTISGDGRLQSERIGIQSSDAFTTIGQALKTDALNNLTLKNIDLSFIIQDGTLQVKPFETSMNNIDMKIEGEQSFDNTLNYAINLIVPRQLLGLENPAINNLYSQAASHGIQIDKSETVDLLVKLTGAMKNPQVKIDLKQNASTTVENIKEEVKETAKEVIETKKEEVKEDVKKKAREEADKILNEADKQATQIKAEGKRAADAVRAEANKNADNVVKEAKNPVAKAAAEQTAKKIRQEGEEKAKQIEKEANSKADKVLQDAHERADKLLK